MQDRLTGWLAALTLALCAFALPAQAQLVLGRDYEAIEPSLPTDHPDKIEVVEFFSYACPHCGELNPHALKWAARLPADVVFRRVPVGFNPHYRLMAKLYYALEVIGELDRLDTAVFSALHDKGLRLIDDQSILDWVSAQGVDRKKFSDAYTSFGVASKSSRGDQMGKSAKIRGVPALMVDGRYLVVGREIKSHADLLALTDKLIAKRRGERKSRK